MSRTLCPNLLREAALYRYPSESERAILGEAPIDKDNHALAALRYLIARLDAHFLGRLRRTGVQAEERRQEGTSEEGIWMTL